MHKPCRIPVVAFNAIEVSLADVEDLRVAPDPAGSPLLPKRFLRHADEQSVLAVRAVQATIAGTVGLHCRSHGVIAAPCQAGRLGSSCTLSKYAEGGGATVTPHIVPQASLHAMAATVSVGLGMHGPSLGVGGSATALSEGLLTLAALGDAPDVEAWWLVATQFVDEPLLDAAGEPQGDANETQVEAVALLIAPTAAAATPPRWWLDPAALHARDDRLASQVRACLVAADKTDGQQREAA